MEKNRLLSFALAVQIGLAFFGPPIPFGDRLLFPADFWSFVWIAGFGAYWLFRSNDPRRTRVAAWLGGIALLFLIVWAHGVARPPLTEPLSHWFKNLPDDTFNAPKEAFVAFRFFMWIAGGMVVVLYRPELARLQRVLAAGVIVGGISLIAGKLVPGLAEFFGGIYHYDPSAPTWIERSYGLFRSPVEASACLGLSLIVLATGNWAKSGVRLITFFIGVVGIAFSMTVTPVVSIFLSGCLVAVSRGSSINSRKIRILSVSLLFLFGLAIILGWQSYLVRSKVGNLGYRIEPWKIFFGALASRPDRLLLGTGFHPHFTDNIFVFTLVRGGLIGLALPLLFLARWIGHRWTGLAFAQRTLVIHLLISGMMADNLIIRPFALVFVAVGVPFLFSIQKERLSH